MPDHYIQRWREGNPIVEKVCMYCQQTFSTTHECAPLGSVDFSKKFIENIEKDTMKDKIEAKIKDCEKQFKELEDKRQELGKKRDELNTLINQALEEQVRLQGEFRALQSLLDDKGNGNGSIKSVAAVTESAAK